MGYRQNARMIKIMLLKEIAFLEDLKKSISKQTGSGLCKDGLCKYVKGGTILSAIGCIANDRLPINLLNKKRRVRIYTDCAIKKLCRKYGIPMNTVVDIHQENKDFQGTRHQRLDHMLWSCRIQIDDLNFIIRKMQSMMESEYIETMEEESA